MPKMFEGFIVYTGSEIVEASRFLEEFKYARVELNELVIPYFARPKLLLGNRRFGKTCLAWMAASVRNDVNRTHIIFIESENYSKKELINYLDSHINEFIVIDEASNLSFQDFRSVCEISPVQSRGNLVLTGTNSLILYENSKYSSPAHGRFDIINIDELTPHDYWILHGLEIDGWISCGGYIDCTQNAKSRKDLDDNYKNYLLKLKSYTDERYLTCMAILDYMSTFNIIPYYNDMHKINTRFEYNNIDFQMVYNDLRNSILIQSIYNVCDGSITYVPRSLLQLSSRFNNSEYFNPKYNNDGKIQMHRNNTFENYIKKISGSNTESYRYRINGEIEIDAIDYRNGLLIEVKYSDKLRVDWLKNLRRIY